jgi:hypothetical protein
MDTAWPARAMGRTPTASVTNPKVLGRRLSEPVDHAAADGGHLPVRRVLFSAPKLMGRHTCP